MDKLLAELEELIRRLRDEHRVLLAMVQRKIAALRMASPALVTDCCARENEMVQRIAALEKRRQAVVGQITGLVSPNAAEPLRLMEIAQHAPADRADRLKVLHAELRGLVEQVRNDTAVARQATQGLIQHMQGMMQNLRQLFAGANTYGRRGALQAGPSTMASSFSMTG